jgi:hypothetical protein
MTCTLHLTHMMCWHCFIQATVGHCVIKSMLWLSQAIAGSPSRSPYCISEGQYSTSIKICRFVRMVYKYNYHNSRQSHLNSTGLSLPHRNTLRLHYEPNRLMLSIGLWRWYINITITILDIILRPVFYLKLNSTLWICLYLTGNTLRLHYELNRLMLSIGLWRWYINIRGLSIK